MEPTPPEQFKCTRCGATGNRRTGVQFTYHGLLAHKKSCGKKPAGNLPQDSLPQNVNEINAGTAGTPPYIFSKENNRDAAPADGSPSNKPIATPIPPRSELERLWNKYRWACNSYQRGIFRAYLSGKPIADGHWVGLYGAIEELQEAELEAKERADRMNGTVIDREEIERKRIEAEEQKAHQERTDQYWQDHGYLAPPTEPTDDTFAGDTVLERDVRESRVSRRICEDIRRRARETKHEGIDWSNKGDE